MSFTMIHESGSLILSSLQLNSVKDVNSLDLYLFLTFSNMSFKSKFVCYCCDSSQIKFDAHWLMHMWFDPKWIKIQWSVNYFLPKRILQLRNEHRKHNLVYFYLCC